MSYVPKEIKEEVNVSRIHPFKHFLKVLGLVAVTGVVLFVGTGLVADLLTTYIDPSFEKSIGQTFSAAIPSPTLPQAKETQVYLQDLIAELRLQNLSSRPPVKVHLLDTETVNAAALPGGEIIVTTGLLDFVQSENELAFVLAHELGHHQYRHPIRRLGRSLLWTTLLSLVGLGNQNSVGLGEAIPGLSQITDLHFSRAQELEADEYALEAVVRHYKHGGQALDFFTRITTLNQGGIPSEFNLEILSTHPIPDNRIQKLKSLARIKGWPLTGKSTPLKSGLLQPSQD